MPHGAALIIRNPAGAENRMPVERLPFRIGRLKDNDLVLRDSRASRHHARIVAENGDFIIEDLQSSYGVFVNGRRIERKKLRNSDRIEFGFPDSYRLTFMLEQERAAAARVPPPAPPPAPRTDTVLTGSNLPKLRAMLEVVRALQTSRSTDDVLAAVVDAALAVTGCERGFLLLRKGEDLDIRVGRSRSGPLPASELRVPTRLLMRALRQRKDFLSMNFDPAGEPEQTFEHSVMALELRCVVCLPLVKVRAGSGEPPEGASTMDDTVGLLYMDSRLRPADLSSGGRELLTTLAVEASTVLENARLLEEQWAHQQVEQELRIARQIQQSLVPRTLPVTGWFRAAAASVPSLQVGGDYLDFRPLDAQTWSAVVADVSGKGVGAALLAALLQGMFLAAPYTHLSIEEMMLRVNRFLNDRTGGEQYVTLFYCTLDRSGLLRWVNGGHPAPVLARAGGALELLAANGLPLGMIEDQCYRAQETRLEARDKLVLYTDGLTEARDTAGSFFGAKRLQELVKANAGITSHEMHAEILASVEDFTRGAAQSDDISLGVLEYRPE